MFKFYLKLFLHKYFLQFLPDALWLKIIFRIKMGCKLDLNNPKTFHEKLQWIKLHNRDPLYTKLVDKYAVRGYVAETIGEEYLIPLLGVWDNFDDIDFNELPDQLVLKCTHDSGGLIICKDKSRLDIKAAKKKINSCLKFNYYWAWREWPYKNIQPRIIAEKYMADESKTELKDYKVFCFDGTPKVLLVVTERGSSQAKFDFFDMEFKHLPFKQCYPNNVKRQIIKPKGFAKMLFLAEKLTKGFAFCRVDFYDINGHVYFGELTLSHFGGFEHFDPREWDYKLGDWINLGIKNNG